MTVRVLLSCKHKVIAEGIAAVLKTHPDMQLVAVSEDDEQTRQHCLQSSPGVVVMGVDPRRAGDVALTRWLAQLTPRPEIVAFSTECDRGAVLQMMQAGASSFVSTQSSMDELLQAIRAAASGRSYLCSSASSLMVESLRRGRSSESVRGQLGEREEQVLCLIADGFSSKEIARNLQIAPSTVEVHRRNIMRKVGLHKVADLTRYAIRNQMVQV
jgi:two-component system NarL family response regulator